MDSTVTSTSKSSTQSKITWPEAQSKKQRFSLPGSIIYYITKNPSTPEVYLKLAQLCKYFFEKNPILIIKRINDAERKMCSNGWKECAKFVPVFCEITQCWIMECCIHFDIQKIQKHKSKIWITERLKLSGKNVTSFSQMLLPKIYRCENALISLRNNKIKFEDFKIIASTFQKLHLYNFMITNNDGSTVMLDSIIASIPIIKEFVYWFNTDPLAATTSTMKNILKLQNLDQLSDIRLMRVPESFLVEDIAAFITNYKDTRIWLQFRSNISVEYFNQIDELIDGYQKTHRVFWYPGQDIEKRRKMEEMF